MGELHCSSTWPAFCLGVGALRGGWPGFSRASMARPESEVSADRFHPRRALLAIMWKGWDQTHFCFFFFLLFLAPPHPSKCQRGRGQGGVCLGSVGWAGVRPGGRGHTLVHEHVHSAVPSDEGGPGLWRLLAPTSLATSEKDLDVWFCLSQSHSLTTHRSAMLALTSPCSLRPNKIVPQTEAAVQRCHFEAPCCRCSAAWGRGAGVL